LAHDVTQQTFLKALLDPAVERLESPKAYLFTVARNTLYDEWKRKKERLLADGEEDMVHAMPDDPLQNPQEQVASTDLRNKVEAAIGRMRPTYRELMLLRYSEDLSIEEISQVTGRGLSDVKVNLHRARLAFDQDFTALMYSRVARARGKCEEIATLLAPFEERELPAEQIKLVDQHLVSCKLCADDAGEMKKRRELFIALPLIPAPLALDQAIQQALVPGAKSAAVAGGAKSAASGAMAKLAAAIGVAAVLAGGGYYLAKNRVGVPPAETARTAVPDRPAPLEPAGSAGKPIRASGESMATVGTVRLQARAVPGGPVLGQDLFWTIYTMDPKTGQRVNVAADGSVTPTFKVPAGRYIAEVRMSQGQVRAEREILVEAGKTTKPLDIILGSGELKLAARLTPQSPILAVDVFWTVFVKDPKTGRHKNFAAGGSARPTFKVPAGRYIVEASLNQGKVRVEREVVVEAGKTIEHNDFV
jgi:RNA polymerase sigma-70 factor (ECF subfamily)